MRKEIKKLKVYLLHDDTSPNFYIARRTEEELKPEITNGLEIGQTRMLTDTIGITRES